MKGVALYRVAHTGKWCLVEIPDGWQPSDPLPQEKSSEMAFDTKEDALIALVGRLGHIATLN
jgi:hypothetical protein